MISEALAASGLFFWVAIVAAFLIVAWPLSNDSASGAMVAAGVFIAGFIILTDVASRLSLWVVLLFLPVYILIGVGWALFKWRGYVLDKKAEARADYDAAVKANGGNGGEEFAAWAVKRSRRPTADQHKEMITGWIALWPWSMSWVVLRFPWRAVVWTYERISTVFERWSAKLWQD